MDEIIDNIEISLNLKVVLATNDCDGCLFDGCCGNIKEQIPDCCDYGEESENVIYKIDDE